MADIIFYSNPRSRGQIVHWMLEELGEPYETRWVGYGEEMKSPEYLAVNPMGKVPALRHLRRDEGGADANEVVLTETAAICAYLAAVYPAAGLMPTADDPALADYYRWLFFAAGPLESAVTVRSMKWQTTPEQYRSLGFGSYDATLDAVEGHLKGRTYICGDRFSAADVCLGSHIAWGMRFGTIEPRQVFKTYAERLTARDAHGRAVRLSQEADAAAGSAG